MRRDRDLTARVRRAKGDARAADELVRDYLPFVKAETARFMGRPPQEGRDDELGIAMFAFHEAVLSYEQARGAFLPLAATTIRNRLIDYRRRERRHAAVASLDERAPGDCDEEGRPLVERLTSGRDEVAEREHRRASRREIAEFVARLEELGLTLAEVAENGPRQRRTLEACQAALSFARERPELLEGLARTGRLPIGELARGAGVERKTLERHRRYLVALLLAYTNGYEIIRGHLCRVAGASGGGAR
ncbi:sigma factor [Olsenella profusa]|uniref:RNA polymerase subunit sigma n=1 Tax=Olsenella profusa TaxID=138595 RepID=A0ABS2F069_9ACTN|nr:sigma factor [Olsenella profusa]MBM6774350.1 RNA polymerase subunit sigma [Olsenella profusa]